jgi:hypothetical protein
MNGFKKAVEIPVCAALLVGGYLVYLVTGKTPALSYQSMVKLFCLTRGRSNDWLSRAIGFFARRYSLPNAKGVLGDMQDSRKLDAVVTSLRDRGYYVFEQRLPDDVCDRLMQFAVSQPSETYLMDGQSSGQQFLVYDRDNPRAVRYEFRPQDLLANPDVQRLLADLSFAAVAQQYLGARPVVDVLTMWWLTGFSDRPDSKAAQYFHFDMDRPKWLKFFIHLTDVTPVSGPHTFVAGSHRTGAIPDHLLEKGYARLTDEQVGEVFAKDDIKEFSAPRGCIVAEDTRGLHKGRHIEQGDRLMLQIQFSNSLFGGAYPKASFKGELLPELAERLKQFPELYSAYL